jgi:hypothetical protein
LQPLAPRYQNYKWIKGLSVLLGYSLTVMNPPGG